MAKAKSKQLKVTLVRSLIGRLPKHKATATCLGLRRMWQTVTLPDNPSVRGMLKQVAYLVNVEEATS